MKKTHIIFLAVIGILSCGKKSIDTRAYYFPYKDFVSSTTYKYVDTKDTSKVLYWNFNTVIQNGDTVFSTSIYTKELILVSVFANRVWDEGVELNEMYINTGKTDTLYKCEVKSGEVFSWKVKPKVSLFVSYAISNKEKTQSEEVVTERTFDPKKEMVSYNGKEYKCLVVREKTLINHIRENTTKTEEQERNSFFAQGIGLIQFETYNADATRNVFKLQKILNQHEWNKILPVKTDSTSISAE